MSLASLHRVCIRVISVCPGFTLVLLARIAKRVRTGGYDVPDIDVRRRYLRSIQNLPVAAGIAYRVEPQRSFPVRSRFSANPAVWLERGSRKALFVVFRQAMEGDRFKDSRDVAVPLPVKPRVRNASALPTQSTPQEKQKQEIMNLRGVILLCFGCALLSCAILQPHI
jgi:hypothetical protein